MARIVEGPQVNGQVISKQTGAPLSGVTVTPSSTVYTDQEMTLPVTTVVTNGNGRFSFYAPPGTFTFTLSDPNAAPVEPVEVLSHDEGSGKRESGAYLSVLSGARQGGSDVYRAQKALRAVIPLGQMPARTATPTVSLANALPGTTPTQVRANTSNTAYTPNTTAFRFTGYEYDIAGGVSPNYQCVASKPPPSNPNGFGNGNADFASDAPTLTFQVSRAQLGAYRVMCDGVEIFRLVNSIYHNGTAQAGAAGSITLAAGASASNGQYLGAWVHLTAGTGAGQYAQITGYTGSTKVATVAPNWTTPPDATSVYEIAGSPATWTTVTQSGFGQYYMTVDWSGERRLRRYRVEYRGFTFNGVYKTSALDTLVACQPMDGGIQTFWVGDSFGAGTGTDAPYSAMSKVACALLGWQYLDASIGGTGYLAPGTNSLTVEQRCCPPSNAWRFNHYGATGGTYTISQGGVTTAALAFNANLAAVQTAFDNAFSAGTFLIAGNGSSTWHAIGLGATATSTAPMTVTSSLTGSNIAAVVEQYLGSIAPLVPKDGAGNPLPFNIVLACGHNDTTANNAAYTAAALQAAVTSALTEIYAAFPTANVIVLGVMWLPGGGVPAAATAADGAIAAACTATAKTINGKVPFIETLTAGIFTGTGWQGHLAADGNGDLTGFTDGAHPATLGHLIYGTFHAEAVLDLLNA